MSKTETRLHSFMDIFGADFQSESGSVKLQRIVIPMIQRDYAQGRIDPDINRVRSRFLDSLYKAVTDKPVTLDFVYGDINEEGEMTPLDGQQRLTTLFLLHWYAAKKEKIPEVDYRFLHQFTYETRYSDREFCRLLVDFNPSFQTTISREIINQNWFPLDWKKDPTISSMLVMIDAIDDKFKDVPDLWQRLKDRAITFYFLPVKDMGLTDELYIKMNSRGKPLTIFEHFKAELEHSLRRIDPAKANETIRKIDQDWTNMLWQYRSSGTGSSEDYVIDDEFLRYFKFICDISCYKNGKSPQGRSYDEFDLLDIYFSPENKEETIKNLQLMHDFFECWCSVDGYDSPSAFLHSFMSYEHEPGKITISTRYSIDIFGDCLKTYSDRSGRNRLFPLNRIVLLYAIISYLLHKDEIGEEAFRRRIRIIDNLIQNSEFELSDRTDRNRIPSILKQVDSIMINGRIDDSLEPNFNVNQLQEEKEKLLFTDNNSDKEEELFKLEDHSMLEGQIGIIGLDKLDYGRRFEDLFNCDWDKVDCALMSIGNYGQRERNGWRYQYGSSLMQSAWISLFHKSSNTGYEHTKEILLKLLSSNEHFTNENLQKITDQFIHQCEESSVYPWEYYYVKYPVFRPGSYGKYVQADWDYSSFHPYMLAVMRTRSNISSSTYMPYLKEADGAHLSKDNFGLRLAYDNCYIECINDGYTVKNNNDELLETIHIAQNEQKIDKENRIDILKRYLENHL